MNSPITLKSSSYAGLAGALASSVPPLSIMADLLSWQPVQYTPLVWRNAFDAQLERQASEIFAQLELDGWLAQGLALLPESARRRFLRAPSVAMLLRRHAGNQFDGRLFAELILAELATCGILLELPESLWSARGDQFLDQSAPLRWTLSGPTLGDTGITLDLASPFQFPDDEFGIATTIPHNSAELEIVTSKLLNSIAELRQHCAPALALVTTFTEVLALRREPEQALSFYSSTFSGYPGLVRLTNGHLPGADISALVEAMVHEAIHCILHVNEELEEPFVRVEEANHTKVVSSWTGSTIRLQSYIHACVVWYGVYWLWSIEGFASGSAQVQVELLRQRAYRGFQHRSISEALEQFSHLLSPSIKELLHELEERMLSLA